MAEIDPKALKRTRGGKERLLAAAAELIRANTLAGTSLQMIADRLGVSKPAIYHHFRSRDDIVAALMEPVIADATAALERLERIPAAERPTAVRGFYTDFVVRHRRVINMVLFDRAALGGGLDATVDRLVDGVASELAGGDESLLPVGIALVYGAAALVTRRQDLDDDELRSQVASVFAALDARERMS